MEITEHKTSKLEELSKDIKSLEDKYLDKSLGRNDEDPSSFEKAKEISFTGSQETERDLASSKLQQELSSCGIYVSGQIYSDSLWGGLDSYSGKLVHDNHGIYPSSDLRRTGIYGELFNDFYLWYF